MIWIGIDAHKRVHQALALSADGVLGQKTVANTAVGWTELLRWASIWTEGIWAVEGSGSNFLKATWCFNSVPGRVVLRPRFGRPSREEASARSIVDELMCATRWIVSAETCWSACQ